MNRVLPLASGMADIVELCSIIVSLLYLALIEFHDFEAPVIYQNLSH
jgi:hypothetical protein